MRGRQLEEVREAGRVEMERRAESKKAGIEDRKDQIKQSKNSKRRRGDAPIEKEEAQSNGPRKSKKRVSFG